jgi:hypothetical protein
VSGSDSGRPRRPKPGTDFSRIPPVHTADDRPTVNEVQTDQDGKRSLFSATPAQVPVDSAASFGAVVVSCSGCDERTVLSPAQALQLAVPSFHLPFIKKDHGSWMRCPSCKQRTWVSVEIQL